MEVAGVSSCDHRTWLRVGAAGEHGHRLLGDARVDREARLGTGPVAEPTDPRRQTLERNSSGCELEPALQQRVAGKALPQRLVDHIDVARIAGERGPTKRADAATEERPYIGRDEARV